MGAALFERNTIPLRLTDCGEKYIECAKQILEIEHSFADYLYNADKLKTGRITIGGSAMGVVGMLVMIPACSVAYSLLRTATRRKLREKGVQREKYLPGAPKAK